MRLNSLSVCPDCGAGLAIWHGRAVPTHRAGCAGIDRDHLMYGESHILVEKPLDTQL